jgi:hypothetical protein
VHQQAFHPTEEDNHSNNNNHHNNNHDSSSSSSRSKNADTDIETSKLIDRVTHACQQSAIHPPTYIMKSFSVSYTSL